MRIFYRISDKSYVKHKLPGCTKRICLQQFLTAFHGQKNIVIVADRCLPPTLQMLESFDFPVEITDLGNAGSFIYAMRKAIELPDAGEAVYFCEDDYIHATHGKSQRLIEEIKGRADYFTLFDHPDKYGSWYGYGETSQVIRTPSSHWRFTQSTCMTFGSTVGRLQQDLPVFEKYTSEQHPHDHHIFSELTKLKGRKLAVCIPGAACHTDLTLSNDAGEPLMEDWALDALLYQLECDLESQLYKLDKGSHDLNERFNWGDTKSTMSPWQRLVMFNLMRDSALNA